LKIEQEPSVFLDTAFPPEGAFILNAGPNGAKIAQTDIRL
jgi:hypothetical protein